MESINGYLLFIFRSFTLEMEILKLLSSGSRKAVVPNCKQIGPVTKQMHSLFDA
jgi:hypothetical protein